MRGATPARLPATVLQRGERGPAVSQKERMFGRRRALLDKGTPEGKILKCDSMHHKESPFLKHLSYLCIYFSFFL